ncbi:variant erythrocyte surface antigen-1, alpha subunit [Babesia caballi]|uniref:Variant erythrocyte surface antigen-1, alpha subunit n=1 Tax=Babesia caballi TaxID=5871 RepID=A0AAV4LX70_BABCB|nr:variant erythrocyte surface antigen-1, alpha subunit [Babesia caballi]
MTALQQKTSLTNAPTNVKEAIDWMLRLSGRDNGEFEDGNLAILGLTHSILELLKTTDQKLERAVEKTFNEATRRVMEELYRNLKDNNGYSAKYFKEFSDVEKAEGKIVDFDKWVTAVKQWIGKGSDPIGQRDGPAVMFADGLATFMGYKKGMLSNEGFAHRDNYKSAYKPDEATWAAVKASNKENECGLIFLQVVITLFPFLTVLYFNGKKKVRTDEYIVDGEWAKETLKDDNSALTKFLKAVGFDDFSQLNIMYTKAFCCVAHGATTSKVQSCSKDPCVKGSTLNGRIGTGFGELGRVMAGGNPPKTYGQFIKEIIERAKCDHVFNEFRTRLPCSKNGSTCDPSKFPLTRLFIIAIAYHIAMETSSSTKAILASTATVAGLGISAYLTYLSGILTSVGLF